MEDLWPNLFVPGAAKSGTTTLHYCLNQHPDIWMSPEKETNYFSSDALYNVREKTEYYLSLFRKGKYCMYRGESSPSYMLLSSLTARRIKARTNQSKFIFILRNPIDRVFSQYAWVRGRGLENRSFEIAFWDSAQAVSASGYDQDYYRLGCYGTLLVPYYETFGKENIHLILTENLKRYPTETINSCFDFLGVHRISNPKVPTLNPTVMLKDPTFYRNTKYVLSGNYNSWAKDVYRWLLPDAVRIKARRWVMNQLEYVRVNVAPQTAPPRLAEETRLMLKECYEQDVAALKRLTGESFAPWADFTDLPKISE